MRFKVICTVPNKLRDYFKQDYPESFFLFFFRLMIGLLAFLELTSFKGDLSFFFSASETVIPQELMYMETGVFKYLYPLSQFFEKNNLYDNFYPFTLIVYITSLTFLVCGVLTRFSAFFALIFQLIIYKSFAQFNYGYDHFMTMSLFYCFIFPVGKYFSIDNLILKKRNSTIHFNYKRVLQIHLSIAYFFSGVAKALDSGWWDGKSVWNAWNSLDNNFYFPPIIYIAGGISTVLFELIYPALVSLRKTRKFILIIMIIMHLVIGITMKLYAFSAIMIIWNIAAFGNSDSVGKKKTAFA